MSFEQLFGLKSAGLSVRYGMKVKEMYYDDDKCLSRPEVFPSI